MKQKILLVVTVMFFCASSALAQSQDFVFKTKSQPHKKGFSHSVSITCLNGVWTPLVQGYENNPEPAQESLIWQYLGQISKSPQTWQSCPEEYQVLEGTWQGFKESAATIQKTSGSVSAAASASAATEKGAVASATAAASATQQTWEAPPPTESWYQERSSEIQIQQHAQSSSVTIRGDRRRTAVLQGIIPSYWQGIPKIGIVHDNSLNNRVVVKGNGGTETIIFTEKTVSRLEKMATNPASGDSLTSICPSQARQLGRALGRPSLTYVPKKTACQDGACEHSKARHLKACTQPLDWRATSNGTPVAYVVCELRGGKREDQVSAAWRFDPKKQGAGPDGWYLGIVRYSQWQPENGTAAWDQIPAASWAHVERISQRRPLPAEPPQLYDVCDFMLFN